MLVLYLWVIIFSIAILFLLGTWVVCEILGLNEVTRNRREEKFNEANEYKNLN